MAAGQWIRAGLNTSSEKNTIAVLDGVRACACLFVIWYHFNLVPHNFRMWDLQPLLPSFLAQFLYFGTYGVTLFFILSGFLLFLPFVKALLFAQSWPSIKRFYLRRVFRILPAYYVTLILVVLLFQREYLQPQHWQELGLFFTFLMDESKTTFKQLNAPFWTLAIEWQFYMLLPFLMLGMRLVVSRFKQAYRLRATLACILAVIVWGVGTRCFGLYFVHEHPDASVLVSRPVLNVFLFFAYGVGGKYLEDFGVGMLLSLCFVYARHPSTSLRLRTTLQKLSPWLWICGLLCLLTMIMWNYNEIIPHTWSFFDQPLLFAHYFQFNELGFSLSFGLCILALLFGSAWLKRPFEWLPLRWIGMISYSLYMWHFPLLVYFIKHINPLLKGQPLILVYSACWLWALVLIVPVCFLSYVLVERPGMKIGEWLTPLRPQTQTVPASPLSPQTENRTPTQETPQRVA